MKVAFLIAFSFASFSIAFHAQAQEADKSSSTPPKLEPVFTDDFSKDSRADYKIEGDVEWEQDHLTLREGASIQRLVSADSWVRLELGAEYFGLKAGENLSEFRVWFGLNEATDCYVQFRWEIRDGKKVHSLALVDTEDLHGELRKRIVRKQNVINSKPATLNIQYRYGLVIVSYGSDVVFESYIENGPATCESIAIETKSEELCLARIEAIAQVKQSIALNEAQQKQMKQVEDAYIQFMQYYQQGKFAQAAQTGEQIAEIRKNLFGDQHREYGQIINDLAAIYCEMGDYKRARPLMIRAGEISKQQLGENHPIYATNINNLGYLYDLVGDYSNAQSLYMQSLEIRKRVLGEKHRDYAMSLNCLGSLYQSKGDFVQSEPLYVQARDIWKEVLGEHHPDYAMSLNNLADLYQSMGKLFGGRAAVDSSLQYLERIAWETTSQVCHKFKQSRRSL